MALDSNPYAAPASLPGDTLEEAGRGPRGIGGWLLIPLISLFLSVVQLALRLDVYGHEPWLDVWAWISHGIPTSLGPRLMAIVIGDGVLVVLTLVVLGFFLTKSRHTPRLMVARVLTRLSLALLAMIVMAPEIFTNKYVLSIQVLAGVAFIAYFRRSRRVKNTFVR